MPHRQVIVIDPETGHSTHTYIDLGPGAAQINHGQPGTTRRSAVGPAGFVVPNHPGISSTRKATP